MSGFLIYASYINAPGPRYFQNRFLRLFPGLLFVTIGGAVVALTAHGAGELVSRFPTYASWFVAQTTLGQAYNPALFRDVGVGVINGSLWTITTEIIFYFAVPVIVKLERRVRHAILIFTAFSFAIYVVGPIFLTQPVVRDKTVFDVLGLTPIVWGWMFGIGMLAVKHFDLVRCTMRWLPLAIAPLIFLAWLGAEGNPFVGAAGNRIGLFYFASYIALVIWLAFGTPFVRLSFDLSYGTYVWHMPVINLLLVLAVPNFAFAVVVTLGMACVSWFFVERPALQLKRQSLKPIEKSHQIRDEGDASDARNA